MPSGQQGPRYAALLNAFNPETYRGGIESFILQVRDLLVQHGLLVDLHWLVPQPTIAVRPDSRPIVGKTIPDFLRRCYLFGRAFAHVESRYDLVITNNFYGLGYVPIHAEAVTFYHSCHAAYANALKDHVPASEYRDLKCWYGHVGDRLGGRRKTKFAVSVSIQEELARHYRFKEVKVVRHGIDTDFFSPAAERRSLRRHWLIPDNGSVGIFVARWEAGKGTSIIEEVVAAMPGVYWLLVVGDTVCPLEGRPHVRVIRDAGRQEIRDLYGLSDFMVFPSLYEGFGLVIVEALACGLPVICTPVGVARELTDIDGVRELILPDLDGKRAARRIIERIRAVLGNTHLRSAASEQGRDVVEGRYSLGHWRSDMIKALVVDCV
jgi:glycosyltransferase involved in cell wall biosynthesis